MIGYDDVRRWRPEPLGSSGEGLRRSISELEAARDAMEQQSVPASWSGMARFAAEARRGQLVRRIEARVEIGRRLMRALFTAETSVQSLRGAVADLDGEAGARQFDIGGDGTVRDLATSPEFTTPRAADAWSEERQRLAQGLADEVGRLVDRAVEIDSALFEAIPYRDEEQERRGLADPSVTQLWGELSPAEREAVLRQVVEEELADLDLDPPPTVTFIDPDDPDADPSFHEHGLNGRWSSSRNEIWIHPDTLDDPQRIGTAAHEARHARQSDAVEALSPGLWDRLRGHDPFEQHEQSGITRGQAETWRDNFDDYITIDPDRPETRQQYYDQPVEQDAFGRGSEYVDELSRADLERLLEEAT